MQISAWIDRRFPEPIEAMSTRIEAQEHRRFLKTHLPFDGLPIYDEVKYIHVARDGRDACMSFHNHGSGFTTEMLGASTRPVWRMTPSGDPIPSLRRSGRILPSVADARRGTGHEDGSPTVSFFHFERTWWEARHRANVLLVHYNDLKADLSAEMRRVADFLGIPVDRWIWPELVEAAEFEAMRRDGDTLMATSLPSSRAAAAVSSQGHQRTLAWRGPR